MPQPPICHHVLANGALCQAAPLRNRGYCRFHLQHIGRRMKAARSRARHQPPLLKLPLLEDLYSVQIAINQVTEALTHREIDPQYGRLLTTVLRLAMQNLKSLQALQRSSPFEMATAAEGAPTTWDTFEQEHDLPANLDLSLDPEVAFPPPRKSAGGPLNPGFEWSGKESTGAPNPAGLGLSTGALNAPGVGMSENDALPLNPTEGQTGTPDDLFRARVTQILRNSAPTGPDSPVIATAGQVEIVEVYEREGEEAMMKCIVEQQRNRKRRERRAQRVHYEEVAHNRNIQFAVEKLIADRQRLSKTAAAKAQSASDGVAALSPTIGQQDAATDRKPPRSEAGTLEHKAEEVGA